MMGMPGALWAAAWVCLLAPCGGCDVRLVESIPEGLVYNSSAGTLRTYEAWSLLLQKLDRRLELASSYWSLRGADVAFEDPSAWEGEDIFQRLKAAAAAGVDIRIAQSLPTPQQPPMDTDELDAYPSVTVKNLDFPALVGAGILHTKLWVVDRRHFYVGSANFDWRSLTQVKEMGVLVTDCPALGDDVGKIFDTYWAVGGKGKQIPSKWPEGLGTRYDPEHRMPVVNTAREGVNETLGVYLSASPPQLCPAGRVSDLDALLRVINSAKKFISLAVMDYLPRTIYTSTPKFFPAFDDALRRAAIERNVTVRLLLSNWTHTIPDMAPYFRSLTALGEGAAGVPVHGKWFTVPATRHQAAIPFARVNHNKYLVTDADALVMTSNWTPDYFLSTGGIGFGYSARADSAQDMRAQLEAVFERDWRSAYAHPVRL